MALAGQQRIRRIAPPESIDRLIGALMISFLLHLIFLTGLFIFSKLKPFEKAPVKKEKPYVVFLFDPGLPSPAPIAPTRVEKTWETARPTPQVKSMVAPKKIVPMKKKKKIKGSKTVVKQKWVEAAKKKATPIKIEASEKTLGTKIAKDESVVRAIHDRKTGGYIDIRKFPYEWYIKVMASKINRNWDTLSINFYTDETLHVTVYFQLDRNGDIKGMKLEQSSANKEIDKSALEAVKRSAPFPPLPSGYKEDILEVHFGFRLEP
ncbi:MAG: TonB family protein [Nitrospinota bacterium]